MINFVFIIKHNNYGFLWTAEAEQQELSNCFLIFQFKVKRDQQSTEQLEQQSQMVP